MNNRHPSFHRIGTRWWGLSPFGSACRKAFKRLASASGLLLAVGAEHRLRGFRKREYLV